MTERAWLSGYAGNTTLAGLAAWTAAYDRPQVTTTYMDYGSSWSQQAEEIGWNQASWLPPVSDGSAVNVLTIGLILCAPNGSKSPNPAALTAAADGSDTSFVPGFTGIAQEIKSLGMDSPSTVIRLGHEMDGNWYPWSTNGDLTLAATYAAAWRRAHDAVKAVCPNVRFNVCYCIGGLEAKLAAHYAGDEYVDFVSFDFYDAEVRSSAAFTASQNGLGFAAFGAFAAAHKKLFSLDEWGLNGNDSNTTNRDNPVYIQGIFDALSQLDSAYPGVVGYDSYFDQDPYFHLSLNPRSAALYKTLWNTYTAPTATRTPTVGASTTTYKASLSAGTHTASVTAVNEKGESVASRTVTFTVTAATAVAGAVTGVAVGTVTNTTAALTWTGATGSPGAYNLFLDGDYVTTVAVSARAYTFSDLAPGTTYTLSVCATLLSVDGPRTSESVTTAPVPGTMIGVSVGETTSDSIVLNWTGAVGRAIDGYDVFLDYQYITYVGGAGTRSYTFTGLAPLTTYEVGVKASMGSTDGVEVDRSATTVS
jgi:hypothetical protein